MIHQGDCRERLRTLDAASVQCCVTSPPYCARLTVLWLNSKRASTGDQSSRGGMPFGCVVSTRSKVVRPERSHCPAGAAKTTSCIGSRNTVSSGAACARFGRRSTGGGMARPTLCTVALGSSTQTGRAVTRHCASGSIHLGNGSGFLVPCGLETKRAVCASLQSSLRSTISARSAKCRCW